MKQLRWILATALFASPSMVAEAQAQSEPESTFFVSVNGGGQIGSSDVLDQSTFTLYAETGTIDNNYKMDRSGALFGVNGGMIVWQNLGFAFGYSRSTATPTVEVAAEIPHPIFFNRPRVSNQMLDLPQTNDMAHLSLVYRILLAPQWELFIMGGPTRLSVEQDIVRRVITTEIGAPFSAVDVDPDIRTISKVGTGFNIGADVAYMIHPNYGAGFLIRYAGGSLDFPLRGGTTSIDVGGLQIAGGLRLRF